MKNNILGQYINGNYIIKIMKDGTKIRFTKEDEFVSSFPECIDLKITNQCDMGCKYCHEDSTIDGKHGDVLNTKFINTLRPFTELALGGGNVLSHPNLIPFLEILKQKQIIANITINQKHFEDNIGLIDLLIKEDLIKGLGVSLINPTDKFIKSIKLYPNAVIHVINGILTKANLEKLYDNNLKLLILGYKMFRRGNDYYNSIVEYNKQMLYDNLSAVTLRFKVVSFDNLALKQLEVKRLLTEEEWNEFFMGDDGQFTMYIDLVNNQFANNSTSVMRYGLLDNIDEMFKLVKSENNA